MDPRYGVDIFVQRVKLTFLLLQTLRHPVICGTFFGGVEMEGGTEFPFLCGESLWKKHIFSTFKMRKDLPKKFSGSFCLKLKPWASYLSYFFF